MKNLPSPIGMSYDEITELLLREEYGYLPEAPFEIIAEEEIDSTFYSGKCIMRHIRLTCKTKYGNFTFPVNYNCPISDEPVPCFVFINFRDNVPDKYLPSEEISDLGYAVMSFCYKDVTTDDNDFTNGLAGLIYPDGERNDTDPGKISIWAWAAMRVMDYALTRPEINHQRISVAGHSRLGKTALLTGALDHRFYCAFSNDSGCSGASIARETTGETIDAICKNYPFWFCKNYYKYRNNEGALPFDQHFLLAANAPHRVYVSSASEDSHACPKNEYLSCIEAGKYYESLGFSGFITDKELPAENDVFHDGYVGYHLRPGMHYISRYDWQRYIAYLNKHKGE